MVDLFFFLQNSFSSYDFVDGDTNPIPSSLLSNYDYEHGTNCAGVVAMGRNNSQCGVGVAYHAKIAGKFVLLNIKLYR